MQLERSTSEVCASFLHLRVRSRNADCPSVPPITLKMRAKEEASTKKQSCNIDTCKIEANQWSIDTELLPSSD